MPHWIEIDGKTHELIEAKRYQEAEALLLNAYEEFKSKKQAEDLDYLIGLMANFYSMPEVEDCAKAERFFLERERLTPGGYSKLQTATFYIYVAEEFSKAVDKVNEIAELPDSRSSPTYYSGLGL